MTFKQAKAAQLEAPKVAGLESAEEKAEGPTLVEALQMALDQANRGEKAKKDWYWSVEKFLLWLQNKHPLCTNWSQLSRKILREYLDSVQDKAPNTVRLMIQPISQTAGMMSREYNSPNIAEKLRLSSNLKSDPVWVYLQDVISFCQWLESKDSHLLLGALLQGVGGLQLQEALRLTWDKVDLDQGLIEISGEVKNSYRKRVIPVAELVTEALEKAVRSRHSQSGAVVIGARGKAYADFCSYSRQMRSAMRKWNPDCSWSPKDLSNCLPTFASLEGIHSTIWEQFIGHSSKGVTARHYVPKLSQGSISGRNVIEAAMESYRIQVVEPLNIKINELKTCNFLQADEIEKEQLVM